MTRPEEEKDHVVPTLRKRRLLPRRHVVDSEFVSPSKSVVMEDLMLMHTPSDKDYSILSDLWSDEANNRYDGRVSLPHIVVGKPNVNRKRQIQSHNSSTNKEKSISLYDQLRQQSANNHILDLSSHTIIPSHKSIKTTMENKHSHSGDKKKYILEKVLIEIPFIDEQTVQAAGEKPEKEEAVIQDTVDNESEEVEAVEAYMIEQVVTENMTVKAEDIKEQAADDESDRMSEEYVDEEEPMEEADYSTEGGLEKGEIVEDEVLYEEPVEPVEEVVAKEKVYRELKDGEIDDNGMKEVAHKMEDDMEESSSHSVRDMEEYSDKRVEDIEEYADKRVEDRDEFVDQQLVGPLSPVYPEETHMRFTLSPQPSLNSSSEEPVKSDSRDNSEYNNYTINCSSNISEASTNIVNHMDGDEHKLCNENTSSGASSASCEGSKPSAFSAYSTYSESSNSSDSSYSANHDHSDEDVDRIQCDVMAESSIPYKDTNQDEMHRLVMSKPKEYKTTGTVKYSELRRNKIKQIRKRFMLSGAFKWEVTDINQPRKRPKIDSSKRKKRLIMMMNRPFIWKKIIKDHWYIN
ncbi:hypothetical protein BDB01DRAFT_771824 [Pilobolus umbonatus]|nr:hypothetical protein BDB01DRAFT_771824 [Pilobolus umbonatus]